MKVYALADILSVTVESDLGKKKDKEFVFKVQVIGEAILLACEMSHEMLHWIVGLSTICAKVSEGRSVCSDAGGFVKELFTPAAGSETITLSHGEEIWSFSSEGVISASHTDLTYHWDGVGASGEQFGRIQWDGLTWSANLEGQEPVPYSWTDFTNEFKLSGAESGAIWNWNPERILQTGTDEDLAPWTASASLFPPVALTIIYLSASLRGKTLSQSSCGASESKPKDRKKSKKSKKANGSLLESGELAKTELVESNESHEEAESAPDESVAEI